MAECSLTLATLIESNDVNKSDGGMRELFTCVLLLLLSIRMVVTAEHTEEDIQQAVRCIREAASALLK